MQQERVSETPPALKMPLLCGGAGVVFLIVGIVGLVLNFLIPGTILLVIGFGALFASFWLHTQSAIKNQKQGTTSVIKASAISDAENQELYDLQHALNDFLLRFYENAAEPDNKLVQLLIDVKTYTELNEKKKTVESELKEIDAEIEGKNQDIRSLFDQYFPHTEYRDDFVKELRESCSRYQTLMAESKAVTEKREALNKKINSCREQIVSVLHTYYPVILPDDLRQGIRELSSEVRDYRELTAKKQAMLEGNAEYQARANALTEEIRRILLSYNALDRTLPYNICLQNLRKRFDGYREATERLARYTQDFESTSSRKMQANALVEQFLAKYQLSGDTPENLLDHADEDVHSRESTEKALAEAQRKLITFMEENPDVENDTADADVSIPNMEELQISEKTSKNKLIILMKNCAIYVRSVIAFAV